MKSDVLLHVPPLRQGEGSQFDSDTSQVGPEKPGGTKRERERERERTIIFESLLSLNHLPGGHRQASLPLTK